MTEAISLIFEKLLCMSISSIIVIIAVALIRMICDGAPRRIICALWALVGIRLTVPFTFNSITSIMPSTDDVEFVASFISTGKFKTPVLSDMLQSSASSEPVSLAPSISVADITPWIWLSGVIIMLTVAVIGYARLRKSVSMSINIGKNVFLCDTISSPFILGVFRPKIYMPSAASKYEFAMSLAHERTHISRRDNIIKPLAFVILTLHWFNPFCWLAFALLSRDIETACDEKVAGNFTIEGRKIYSQALLSFAPTTKKPRFYPLAFCETGISSRIKRVLNFKSPSFWVIAVTVILAAATAVICIPNPTDKTGKHSIDGIIIDDVKFECDDVKLKTVRFNRLDDSIELNVVYEWGDKSGNAETKTERYTLTRATTNENGNVIANENITDDKIEQIVNSTVSDNGGVYFYTLPLSLTDYGAYTFSQSFTRNGVNAKLTVDFEIVKAKEKSANTALSREKTVDAFKNNIKENKSVDFTEKGSRSLPCQLTLDSNGNFVFLYDYLSSYLPYGSYGYDNGEIVCTTLDNNGIYRFKIISDTEISFSAERSSPVRIINPMGGDKVSLEKNTVFSSSNKN